MLICKILGHNYVPTGGDVKDGKIYLNWFICTRKGCGKVVNKSDFKKKV